MKHLIFLFFIHVNGEVCTCMIS